MIDKNQQSSDLAALPTDLIYPDAKNPVLVYLVNLSSANSRATMISSLKKVAVLLGFENGYANVPWHLLTYSHMIALKTQLLENYASPTTVNRILSALRGILKQAWKLGYMDTDAYHRAVDIPNLKIYQEPAGRMISEDEILRMLKTVLGRQDPIARRDAAVLALLFGLGLRRAEIAAIKLEDYEQTTGRLLVLGKGRKKREVFVVNNQKIVLEGWLEVRGGQTGSIFRRVNKSGKIAASGGITAQAVYNLVKQRALEARIEDIKPHDLRRTYISNLLDKIGDLSIVADLVGHEDTNTTRRYDRRPSKAKMKAAEQYSIPLPDEQQELT